ncbi:hypothetical protein KP003_14220 [Geomonas nitrogeniifigens]|uniref:hypothetical protein n=1 Tax=Geomonas diazotrophica TaxID=2843197 RepID=UPI001C2C2238|nr:hypothetical protein [Geomonas nitrogeniifigens]QXE85532.1 hypothetical protein KP003_14220 [Geomonas nitrogeniifigens]
MTTPESVSITEVHVFGKKSSVTDFTFLTADSALLPEELRKRAEDWLQVHVNARNKQTVAIVKIGKEYWLLRAANEAGMDASGRVLSYVAFGALPADVLSRHATDIIVGAFTAKRPDKNDVAGVTIPFNSQSTPAVPRDEVCATVAVITGDCLTPRVGNPATASKVISHIGMDALNFVLLAESLPTNLPQGPGLVLTSAGWDPPLQSTALAQEIGDISAFDCVGLMGLGVPPSRRTDLLLMAAGGRPLSEPGDLSMSEVLWLLNAPPGRKSALAYASGDQISLLLGGGHLTRGDLTQLRCRLSVRESERVAQLLGTGPEDLRLFVELFGKGASGIETLLPPDAAELWRKIKSREALGGSCPVAGEALLVDSGLLEQLSVLELAPLMGTYLGPTLKTCWRTALRNAGYTEEVLDLLFKGLTPGGHPPIPELDPAASWIGGISYHLLESAGDWMCKQKEWRDWWVRAISCHPENVEGEEWLSRTERYTGKWRWWFQGAVADGELTVDEGLGLLKKWHVSPHPPTPYVLRTLWSALNLERAYPVAKEILNGTPDLTEPDEATGQILSFLVQRGFFNLGDLFGAVQRGFPLMLLQSAGFNGLVALIDCSANPPSAPPEPWDESISPLLATACGKPEFWGRWPEGIPETVLEWLSEKIASEANATLVEAVKLSAKGRLLTLAELHIVSGGLSAETVCRQVGLRAVSREVAKEREAALRILLSSAVLPESKRNWLKAELLEWRRQEPMPPFTAAELQALLPVLHPVRDVLRVVLSRDEVDPDENLLLPHILRLLPRESSVPVAPPPRELARRRPAWIEAVSTLPGWEHWSELALTEGLPSAADTEEGSYS